MRKMRNKNRLRPIFVFPFEWRVKGRLNRGFEGILGEYGVPFNIPGQGSIRVVEKTSTQNGRTTRVTLRTGRGTG